MTEEEMPTLDMTRFSNVARSLPDDLDDSLLLESLPVGVYACDADGVIVRYNRAAAALWGREPRLGETDERFCGSYRLFDLGRHAYPVRGMSHGHALATGRSFRDERIQIERPDGSRIVALVNIEVLKNAHGRVTGAVNVFRDSGFPGQGRRQATGHVADVEAILQSLPAALYTTDRKAGSHSTTKPPPRCGGCGRKSARASSVARGSSTGPMERPFRMTNAPWRSP